MASHSINISINGSNKASSALKQATQEVQNLNKAAGQHVGTAGGIGGMSSQFSKIEKGAKSAGTRLRSFADETSNLGGAMTGLIGIGIGAWLASCVKEAANADAQWKKLNATLAAHGENVQAADESVYKLANTYGFATKDVRDATLALSVAGQSMQQITKNGGDMQAVLGLASAKSMTASEAANQMERAYQGNGRALKSLGLNIKDYTNSTTKKIDVDKLNDAVINKTAASLDAQGKSSEATMMRMSNATEHLQVALGKALLPAVSKLTDVLVSLSGWFDSLSPQMQGMVTDATALFAVLAGASMVLSPLIQVIDALGKVGGLLKDGVVWVAKYVMGLRSIPKVETTTIEQTGTGTGTSK